MFFFIINFVLFEDFFLLHNFLFSLSCSDLFYNYKVYLDIQSIFYLIIII